MDTLEKKSKLSGSLADRCKFARARNDVTSLKRNLKENYFQQAFDDAGNDPKKIWRIIRQLLGSGQRKSNIMEINRTTDAHSMANEINNFFSDIGGKLASEIPDSLLDLDFTFNGDYEKFSFRPVMEKEVKKLLRSMLINKSTGVDGISICFLKDKCGYLPLSTRCHATYNGLHLTDFCFFSQYLIKLPSDSLHISTQYGRQ